jgi:hypothetical protein
MHTRAHRLAAIVAGMVLAVSVLAAPAAAQPADGPKIMGEQQLTVDQVVGWFRSTGRTPRIDVSLRRLVRLYLEEGRSEFVRGDIAFAQSVLETGFFSFPDYGQVRTWHHNYAGIGAVDGGSNPNQFANARMGVRAQVQHLRAYADPHVSPAALSHDLVDPRFELVRKGSADRWMELSGRWASDSHYGEKILALYRSMKRHGR